MITLATTNYLAGVASAGAKLTCSVFGMELNGTAEVYKVLYQGQLAATVGTIYTAPSLITTFIRTITVVNTDVTDQTFTLYVNGTASSNAISSTYLISAGGSAVYEDGSGWSLTTVEASATLLNDQHTGYSEYDAIANPSAPSSGNLRFYAKAVSGRLMPKFTPPSGMDTPLQPALFGNNIVLYTPNTGTTAGINIGTPWAVGTTIGHPTPSIGAYTQIKRTSSTMVATTANQLLGVSSIVNGSHQFWVGNSAGQGGFFFFARFGIEALTAGSPNATRMFVGLQSGTVNILASDTIPAISCVGLWHDTTDGAGVMSILTKNGSASTKNALTGSPTTPYVTGQGYDFFMFCKPNDSTIYYRLDNINLGTTLVDSSVTTTLPLSSTFMGPVVGMSNGSANNVVSTVAIGINRVYIESDH